MDGTMRTRLKIALVISFLLLLGSGDLQVRGLRVTGKDVPTEALRGEDVTIPCLLSGVPIPLNLEKLSVVWTLRLQNGTEREVYGFRSSHHKPSRPGSHMNDKDLLQGNASLSLPNIQITDEGDYRCFVIVTPDSGSTTSTLHVSVKPQTTLSHFRLLDLGYLAINIFCDVSYFYPETVDIQWVKYSKYTATSSSLHTNFFLTKLLRNSDGTFNVTSMLSVRSSTGVETGDVLSCIVSHRSLKEKTSVNFTVPRRNPVVVMWFAVVVLAGLAGLTKAAKNHFKKGWRPWIDVLQCAVLISMLPLLCFTIHFTRDFDDVGLWMYIVLSAGIILYSISFVYHMTSLWRYFSIGNITVSELSGERSLYHMERTTLTCQITEFRRKQIQINVYLKRRRDIKKQLISAWEPTDWTSNNASTDLRLLDGDQGENNSVVLPMLEEGAERRTLLPVKIEVEITKSCLGTYECLCSITITPSVKDNGAILVVEVEYITLKRPIFKCRTLNVYSTEVGRTIVSKINGETWIPHKKKTTLSCQIIGFRQKELLINLYLKRHNDIKNRLIHSWVSVDRPLGEDNATAGHQSGDTIAENPLLDDAVYDTTLPVEMEVVMTKAINGSYTCDCSISLTPNADTDDGAELTVEVDHTSLRWPIDKSHILNVFKGDKPSLWRRFKKHCIR